MEEQVQELTMLLIYLTGWEEDKRKKPTVKELKSGIQEKVFRSWRGYRYEILQALENQGLINQVPGGKSLVVTDKGKQKFKELKKKYF